MNKKIIIETLLASGTLKEIKRTGWVLKGIKNPESVADHTWRMSLIILLLCPKKLNKEKLLMMNAIHDLGEIGVGDIKWETGKKRVSPPHAKHKDEINTLNKLFSGYSTKRNHTNLLKEFNEQKTPEAKYLKQVDKLEMALQAYEYEKQGYSKKKFDEFWENAEMYLKGKKLEPIFRKLQEMRKKI